MISDSDDVLQRLKDFPAFRERKKRAIFLTKLTLRKIGLIGKEAVASGSVTISIDSLKDFGRVYASYERYWRKHTDENEELRGTDWNDRTALEQEKILSLGYEVGYTNDVKGNAQADKDFDAL